MDKDEPLIDSLLHEHARVAGQHDEPFLAELEARIDEEEAKVQQKPKRSAWLTWAPVSAVAAVIIGIISLSLADFGPFKDKSSEPYAVNDSKRSHEQLEKSIETVQPLRESPQKKPSFANELKSESELSLDSRDDKIAGDADSLEGNSSQAKGKAKASAPQVAASPSAGLSAKRSQKLKKDTVANKETWSYSLSIQYKGSRSETIEGLLLKNGIPQTGAKLHETIDTPIGKFKWYGTIGRYNKGWILMR